MVKNGWIQLLYLTKIDGWIARLLSKGDRFIYITWVLDLLVVYFMSVFRLPKKVLKILDAYRRSFFWTNEETCTSSKCTIAWKNMSKHKNIGGLGFKNLAIQNYCLLMKLAFKLLQRLDLSWVQWPLYFLWKIVNLQLPILQHISFVLTNDGRSIFIFIFWLESGS